MRTLKVVAVCGLAALWSGAAPGCIPILIHAQMQAEAARHTEWERENFEREKSGMPILTYDEWLDQVRERSRKADGTGQKVTP